MNCPRKLPDDARLPTLRIRMFGELEICLDEKPFGAALSDKTRALLGYLATERGHAVRREYLAGFLWPESPEPLARHSLSQAIYSLRSLFNSPQDAYPIQSTPSELAFTPPGPTWLDTDEFDSQVDACRRHPHSSLSACLPCLQRMEQTVGLYNGEFWAGFVLEGCEAFEDWLRQMRQKYVQTLIHLSSQLVSAFQFTGEIDRALFHADRLASLAPYNEDNHRQVMRLLVQTGRRAEAVIHYQELRQNLAADLGLEPDDETTALYRKINLPEEPSIHTNTQVTNLPLPLTPMVGRQKELTWLCTQLTAVTPRQITILGMGGAGKSRLALEAALTVLPAFPDGAFLIEINSHLSADMLLPAIARSVGMAIMTTSDRSSSARSNLAAQLRHHLHDKKLLLVLDGFERLAGKTALVSDLLEHAPWLKILVTSRARLNLEGETILPLDGLPFPATTAAEGDFDSVELFVQAARRSNPDFTLTPHNRAAVNEICSLIQGMPLGILLAACWQGTLDAGQTAREIRRGLDFLIAEWQDKPEHQRSLRATFEYSLNLLDEAERRACLSLSVFPSRFNAQRAGQVCAVSLLTLKKLVDQSLLLPSPPEHFRMHDLLRQFAAETFSRQSAENLALRRHFCQVYLDALAAWHRPLHSAGQIQALAEISLELGNLRPACAWAVEFAPEDELERGFESLSRFYWINGRFAEGAALCEEIVERLADTSRPPNSSPLWTVLEAWRARFLIRLEQFDEARQILMSLKKMLQEKASMDPVFRKPLALTNLFLGASDHLVTLTQGIDFAQQSLRLYQELNQRWEAANALILLASLYNFIGDRQTSLALASEALKWQQEQNDPHQGVQIKVELAYSVMLLGDYEAGLRLADEIAAYYRQVDSPFSRAWANQMIGLGLFHAGRFAEARPVLQKNLDELAQLGLHGLRDANDLFLCCIDVASGQYTAGIDHTRRLIERVPDHHAIGLALIGTAQAAMGEHSQARATLEESIAVYHQIERKDHIGWPLALLGLLSFRDGDLALSRAYLIEGIETALAYPAHVAFDTIFLALADVLAGLGDLGQAVELYTAATRHPYVSNSPLFEDIAGRRIAQLTAALPADVRAAAAQRGCQQDAPLLARHYFERLRASPDLRIALLAARPHPLPPLIAG